MQTYWWHGENDFLLKEKLKDWRQAFLSKYPTAPVLVASTSDPAWLTSLWPVIKQTLAGSGLFASKRLVALELGGKPVKEEDSEEKTEEWQEELLSIIPKLDKDVFLLLWSTSLDKRSKFWKQLQKLAVSNQVKTEEFFPFDQLSFAQWAKREAKEQGIELNSDAATTLGERLSWDGWQGQTEIAKLAAYRQGETITKEDVVSLLPERLDDNIFHFVEAVANCQTPLALKLLNDQLQQDPFGLATLGMVVWQFRTVLLVKDYLQQGENPKLLASKLSLKPFVADKAKALANRYQWEELKKIYRGLLDIELGLKTSQTTPSLALTNLIVGL